MNKIILWIFCAHLLLISNISAKFTSCEYNEIENFIYFIKYVQYTCELSLGESERYKKITGIGGEHNDDQDDDTVLAVQITSDDSSLTELTNVVCKTFKNLEYLSIVDVKVTSVHEDSFQNCPNLTLLYLEKNKLQNIPENLLRTNVHLVDFKLSSNEIKSLPEDTFEMQENLKRLDLMNNKIESLPAGVFRALTKLERLYLNENQIIELNIEWFKSLRNLMILSLNKNKINNLPEKVFRNLVNLTMLEMNNNKLTEIRADSFAVTGKLKGLKFDNNKIYSIDPKLTHNNPIGVLHMVRNICFNGQLNTRDKSMDEKLKRCHKSHELSRTTTTTEEPTEEITEELTTTTKKTTTTTKTIPTTTISITTIPPTTTTRKPRPTKPTTTTTTQSFIDDDIAVWLSSDYVDSTAANKLPLLSSITTNKATTTKPAAIKPPTTTKPITAKPWIASTNSPIINIQPAVATQTQKPIGKTCGLKHHSIKDIRAGQNLVHGQFPWNVAIFTTKGVFKCGGVLVTNRKIVTSAKCMYKTEGKKPSEVLPRDIIVILGSHNVYKLFEVGKVSMAVKTIHIHEDYKVGSKIVDADIAVIVLDNDANLNNYVNTICLIDSDKNQLNITDGTVVSYGHSEAMKFRPEMSPRKFDVAISEYEECLDKSEDFEQISTNRSLCTGENEGPIICDEDMGSGLFVKYENRYYLRGIVSTAIKDDQGKCEEYGYTLLTDIAKFTDWIEKLPLDAHDFDAEEQSGENS